MEIENVDENKKQWTNLKDITYLIKMITDKIRALDIEILQACNRIEGGAILVEGFTKEECEDAIKRFSKYIQNREKSLSLDFLEIMNVDTMELRKKLANIKNLFVYNMDLFGEEIDPDKATHGMKILRASKNEHCMSELMFARPNANLDYNSKKGYTYRDNHPLGNWCEFYFIDNGKLVSQNNPIKHRTDNLLNI